MLSVTTVQDKIATVAERWKEAFYDKSAQRWRMITIKGGKIQSAQAIYEQLTSAGKSASRESVVEIMGGDNWIRVMCDHCKRSVDAIIVSYQSDDYNACLCRDCVENALETLKKATGTLAVAGL